MTTSRQPTLHCLEKLFYDLIKNDYILYMYIYISQSDIFFVLLLLILYKKIHIYKKLAFLRIFNVGLLMECLQTDVGAFPKYMMSLLLPPLHM